jgi:hypothetical protein
MNDCFSHWRYSAAILFPFTDAPECTVKNHSLLIIFRHNNRDRMSHANAKMTLCKSVLH